MGSLWQFGDRPAEEVVGKRRAMLTSLSHRSVPDLCEMAVVANATGMMPDRPLFHAPVARIDEMPDLFCPKADGGLFDALLDTGGDILVATNDEARAAKKLFAELEGVDIYSAPAVALATLIKSVRDGRIAPEEYVMLNVTGGGEKRFMEGKELFFLKPSHVFDIDPDPKEVAEKVEALFE